MISQMDMFTIGGVLVILLYLFIWIKKDDKQAEKQEEQQ